MTAGFAHGSKYRTTRRSLRFVGVPGAAGARVSRPPATQLCSSAEDARQWVEDEARAFGLPVEWVNEVPP
jgi:hypothetical protein